MNPYPPVDEPLALALPAAMPCAVGSPVHLCRYRSIPFRGRDYSEVRDGIAKSRLCRLRSLRPAC
jgi:hypothetical protein